MILLDMKSAKIRGDVLMEGWGMYEETIVCTGARWSFESPMRGGGARSGGSGGASRRSSSEGSDSSSDPWESTVALDKNLDKASPDLMKLSMMPEQRPIEVVALHCVETIDEDVWDYLEIRMGEVYIVEWSLSAPEDRRPTESITLGFNKIWMQVTQYSGEAGPGRGWDRKLGQTWSGS